MRPKLAYYAVARELRPVTVGILRTVRVTMFCLILFSLKLASQVAKNRPNDRPAQVNSSILRRVAPADGLVFFSVLRVWYLSLGLVED